MKKSLRKVDKARLCALSLVLIFIIFGFFVTRLMIENTMKSMITAKITELTAVTTVRVRSVVYDIVVGCLQNSINRGEVVSANISVTNKGSYQGDMQITWWVENSFGIPLNVSGSSAINVQPAYTWTSTKTFSLPSSISTGTYYFESNVSAPTYYGTAHCSFEVIQPVATTISPATGGGSPSQPTATKETASVSKISIGEEGIFNYKSSNLPVSEISINVVNSVQNVKVSVTKGSCGGEGGNVPGLGYQTVCIEKENIENVDMKDVKIKFKVEKSWISKNEISLSSMSLYRYTSEWNKLITNIVDEDVNNIYFEAKTFSLSTFAISGEKIGQKKQVDISYPSSFSAFRNSTKRIYMQVKNYENTPLNNLKLILQGLELTWFKIIPNNVILSPQSTQEFAIEFTIPADALTKNYPVNVIVKSDEFEEYLKMNMEILEILPVQKIQEKINELGGEAASLENRMNNLQESGVEVVAVRRLLEVAKEKLTEAQSELQTENYGRASEILHDVEVLLSDIKEAIIMGPFEIRPLSLVLGGIILLGVLMLSVGRIRLLLGGVKMTGRKKQGIGILEKIKFALLSNNCPKCHRKMEEMYKSDKLIGYRCPKCKRTIYKSG